MSIQDTKKIKSTYDLIKEQTPLPASGPVCFLGIALWFIVWMAIGFGIGLKLVRG